MQHSLQRINRNIIRITSLPFHHQINRPINEDDDRDKGVNSQLQAKLVKIPRTLHELWQEYELGSPGRKLVKDWTAQERGKCKYTICIRKFLCNKVAKIVQAGIDANLVCDQIYSIYGQNTSVTSILKAYKRDHRDRSYINPHIQQQ